MADDDQVCRQVQEGWHGEGRANASCLNVDIGLETRRVEAEGPAAVGDVEGPVQRDRDVEALQVGGGVEALGDDIERVGDGRGALTGGQHGKHGDQDRCESAEHSSPSRMNEFASRIRVVSAHQPGPMVMGQPADRPVDYRRPMRRIQRSAQIDAPPAKVYAFLSDPTNLPL